MPPSSAVACGDSLPTPNWVSRARIGFRAAAVFPQNITWCCTRLANTKCALHGCFMNAWISPVICRNSLTRSPLRSKKSSVWVAGHAIDRAVSRSPDANSCGVPKRLSDTHGRARVPSESMRPYSEQPSTPNNLQSDTFVRNCPMCHGPYRCRLSETHYLNLNSIFIKQWLIPFICSQ